MSVRLSARVPDRDVEVDLSLAAGETLALLGPNGAGKSTVLGVLAGLVRPADGRATLAGETLFDLPATWLPPHRRAIALLAQDALLFPHLSVRSNVEFAPRSAGASRAQARARADEWLDRVGVRALADRRPAGLSGGQAQRVAIARALAAEPELILLDEPLASLDVAVAGELRGMLADVLAGRTAIVVTHDALDAHLLADRVAVLHGGRVVEQGPTREVLTRPRHPFTAELRPSAVTLRPGAPQQGARNQGGTGIAAVVTALEPRDDLVRVRTDRLTALLPAAMVAELRLTTGASVTLHVPPGEVRISAA